MKLAAVLEALHAAGGTPEQLIAVVRAAEAEQEVAELAAQEVAEQKAAHVRVLAAERQRRRRASRAVTQSHAESRVTSVTSRDIPSPPPVPSSFPPNPPSNNPSPPPLPDGEGARENSTSLVEAVTIEEQFAEFWREYPNKVGRPDAFKAFIRAIAGEKVRGKPQRSPVTLARILVGLADYVRDKPPDQNWLNPSTFLNGERYLDERAPPTTAPKAVTPMEMLRRLDVERERIRQDEDRDDSRRQIAFDQR